MRSCSECDVLLDHYQVATGKLAELSTKLTAAVIGAETDLWDKIRRDLDNAHGECEGFRKQLLTHLRSHE